MSNELQLSEAQQARVIESLVVKGDVSGLSPQERASYYVALCRQLGLNPATHPLQFLRLNGKEVLYPTRGATDQLAAMHALNRETLEGPEVRKFGNVDLLYCKVRVTLPNGRSETAIATLAERVDGNSLMKVETKAKRRATLSILGMLDETEIEAIPAEVKQPVAQPDVAGYLEAEAIQAEGNDEPSLVDRIKSAQTLEELGKLRAEAEALPRGSNERRVVSAAFKVRKEELQPAEPVNG